jgi:CBS domain containing-hemolysin-like protein
MDILVTIASMVFCLIAEGFFSGSEMAVKGSAGARLALEMLKNTEWLLSTTLVGTNADGRIPD